MAKKIVPQESCMFCGKQPCECPPLAPNFSVIVVHPDLVERMQAEVGPGIEVIPYRIEDDEEDE